MPCRSSLLPSGRSRLPRSHRTFRIAYRQTNLPCWHLHLLPARIPLRRADSFNLPCAAGFLPYAAAVLLSLPRINHARPQRHAPPALPLRQARRVPRFPRARPLRSMQGLLRFVEGCFRFDPTVRDSESANLVSPTTSETGSLEYCYEEGSFRGASFFSTE
jgi:hypothetical protein